MTVIDADAHVIETDHTWSYLPDEARRYAPSILQQLSGSFRAANLWAVLLGVLSSVGGVVVSYQLDTASGGTIVLIAIVLDAEHRLSSQRPPLQSRIRRWSIGTTPRTPRARHCLLPAIRWRW